MTQKSTALNRSMVYRFVVNGKVISESHTARPLLEIIRELIEKCGGMSANQLSTLRLEASIRKLSSMELTESETLAEAERELEAKTIVFDNSRDLPEPATVNIPKELQSSYDAWIYAQTTIGRSRTSDLEYDSLRRKAREFSWPGCDK